jgi:hypothetical protein
MVSIVPLTCTPTFSDCVMKCGDDGSCPNGLSCNNGFCTNHGVCDHAPGSTGRSADAAGSTQANGGQAGLVGGRGNGGARPDASPDSSAGDGSSPFDAADAHHLDGKGRDPGLDPPDASVGADSSTQTPEDYRYKDRTGKITINVRTCAPIVLPDEVEAKCDVPDDFVLIGGGAELLDNSEDPDAGAVLARSAPFENCPYWSAAWIDRDPEHHKRARAYSISIRLESRSRPGRYIRANELAAARVCESHRYPADGSTKYAESLDPGYLLVGGGVTDAGFPWSVALLQSYPSSPSERRWFGAGVVPGAPPRTGEIRITSIGLPGVIVDFGSIETHFEGSTVSCGVGHLCTSMQLFSSLGGVATSVGGIAQYAGLSRYLSGLVPLAETNGHVTTGVTMTTRDFLSSDTSDVRNQSALLLLSKSP